MKKTLEGTLVPNEQVLAALGHPATWARDERKNKRTNLLRPGETELGICGIKKYLAYLRQSFSRPLGTDTGLISAKENEQLLAAVRREITDEMTTYQATLQALEGSIEGVTQCLVELEHTRNFQLAMERMLGDEPDGSDAEELNEYLVSKVAHTQQLAAIIADIRYYTQLLEKLRATSLPTPHN